MQREAYDDFYGHYKPYVAAFVARRVPADSASDLVADVFTIAWRKRAVLPDDALPWLYRTARNVIGDSYRRNARIAALEEKLRSEPNEQPVDPAEISVTREQLIDAFVGLQDTDQEVLLLASWEGLSNEDVATVLEITAGAVAVRLHRARQRLNEATDSGSSPQSSSTPGANPSVTDISQGKNPPKIARTAQRRSR